MTTNTLHLMGPEELKRTITLAQKFHECCKDPDVIIVLPNSRQYAIENVGILPTGDIALYVVAI